MKVFIIVDMQNGFTTGSLANPAAEAIIPSIAKMAEKKVEDGWLVISTRDTHDLNYMQTQEGKKLPVPHCLKDTDDWQVVDELKPFIEEYVDKPNFGFTSWGDYFNTFDFIPEEIELCGTVSDICVAANATILKATFPEIPIRVHRDLCAGLTPEGHNAAMSVMAAQQIDII